MKSKINLKTYILIINLVISVFAFNFLISAAVTEGDTGGVTPPGPDQPGGDTGGGDVIINTDSGGTGTIFGGQGGGGQGGDGQGGPDGTGGGGTPPGGPSGGGGGGIVDNIGGIGSIGWQSMFTKASIGASLFASIGSYWGKEEEGAKYGAIAGAIGGAVAGFLTGVIGEQYANMVGLAVAFIVFIMIYKEVVEEITEFHCLPWQAPIGGGDCQVCNDFTHCSQYSCKSLGQACEVVNPGSEEQRCVWQNPYDVNSPMIIMREVSEEHSYEPDISVRPPATGIKITRDEAGDGCIRAFFPLEFTFDTDEPAQCKIDYDLTTDFESMSFYMAGNSYFLYNHTEKLALPGPNAINAVNPEIQNDGEYTLFIRCRDANGNFNQDAYSVSFCVEKGPDTTPPIIVDSDIPSGQPIQFNTSSIEIQVYVNEPAECRWSKEDIDYKNMAYNMSCNNKVWEMNYNNVYTCIANLTGLRDRVENQYYFKCKDQPWEIEANRNVNAQSYLYKIVGTQALNILEVSPFKETISGSANIMAVDLSITTDNGYRNGEAICYYYKDNLPDQEEDYIEFSETRSNKHTQRQDLVQGTYQYYFKCVDLGGNTVYNQTTFEVKTDRSGPQITRVYRERQLKVITDENAECSYSVSDCNFEIEDGIQMSTTDFKIHNAEWELNQNYYIRCKDKYDNQPNPNICSIIVKPSEISVKEAVEEFGFGGFS